MKKITMTKYGFIRNELEDFSDDGNRFICYTVSPTSRLRISKLVSDGHAYLSASMDGNKLDYNEYSACPHYQEASWKYNGQALSSLTEEDMINFYNACVEYEKEYLALEANITFPTLDELKNQCIKIRKLRKSELDIITNLITIHGAVLILKSSEYEIRTIKDYYKSLERKVNGFDPETYPASVQYSNYGRNFVKETNPDLKQDWYYTQLKELINTIIKK